MRFGFLSLAAGCKRTIFSFSSQPGSSIPPEIAEGTPYRVALSHTGHCIGRDGARDQTLRSRVYQIFSLMDNMYMHDMVKNGSPHFIEKLSLYCNESGEVFFTVGAKE